MMRVSALSRFTLRLGTIPDDQAQMAERQAALHAVFGTVRLCSMVPGPRAVGKCSVVIAFGVRRDVYQAWTWLSLSY